MTLNRMLDNKMDLSVKRLLLAITVGFAILVVDQSVKLLIVEFVMQPPRDIPLLPFLNLTLAYNRGVTFGLFADQIGGMPGAFGMLKIAVAVLLLAWAATTKSIFETIALGSIAGGAAGNIVDRLRDGAVTDFIDVYAGSWHWPVFNMADIAIMLGATAVLLHSLVPIGKSADGRSRK